jgi:hypothetical protein
MPKITPAALRTAAAKQRVHAPYRFGNTVCARTDHWDAVIVRRQQNARRWRETLADWMDSDGVTELRVSTIRIIERPSFRCRPITLTVYAYTDGSPYLYRRGTQFYSPAAFGKAFGDHYTITPSGEFSADTIVPATI